MPDKIVEKIIVLSIRSSDEAIFTFNKLSLTCSRFSTLLQRRSHYLLTRVPLQSSGEDLKKVSKYNGKIKTKFEKSKNRKTFRGANKDKKWKSVWLLLEPGKYSMYCIRNFYWKSVDNGATNPIVIVDLNYNNFNNKTARISNGEKFWIRNGLYNLKTEDADILHSQSAWLNDRTMDAAQKLICKTFGDERSYQSVLKMQRKVSLPFQTVNHDHIQLWHDGSSHWFLDLCSSS